MPRISNGREVNESEATPAASDVAEPGTDAALADHLSIAMRTIRRRRGLKAAEVAARMGMPLRSYENFEAGRGRLTAERLSRFADATDCDVAALAAAAALGVPSLALHCMDNKLVLILMYALKDFEAELGAEIAELRPSLLISAFTRLFGDLALEARKRDLLAEAWLESRGRERRRRPPD